MLVVLTARLHDLAPSALSELIQKRTELLQFAFLPVRKALELVAKVLQDNVRVIFVRGPAFLGGQERVNPSFDGGRWRLTSILSRMAFLGSFFAIFQLAVGSQIEVAN